MHKRRLSIEDEKELIKAYQDTRNANAIRILISDNEPYLKGLTAQILGDDTEWTIAVIAFAETAKKYRHDSTARLFTAAYLRIKKDLLTYAYRQEYDGEVARMITANRQGTATPEQQRQYNSLTALRTTADHNPHTPQETPTHSTILAEAITLLTDTEKTLYRLYMQGYNRKELTKHFGYTLQQQNRLFDSIVAKIKNEL